MKPKQSKIKKRLTLDSDDRFESIFTKENQAPETPMQSPMKTVKTMREEKNTQLDSKSCKKARSPISHDKLSDLMLLKQLEVPGPKIVEKNPPLEKIERKSSQSKSKLGLMRKTSISLPKLTKDKKRVQTFNQIYYRSPEIKFEEVEEMIEFLKAKGILISDGDNYMIKKEHFQEILNYFMCLAKTTDHKKLLVMLENFPIMCDMEDISMNIFNKLKEKVYPKKRKLLKICSSEIKVEYRPQLTSIKSKMKPRFTTEKEKQKNREKEKDRAKDKSMRKLRTKKDLYENQGPMKIKTMTCFKKDRIPELSFKPSNFTQLRNITTTFKANFKQYEQIMNSPDFTQKISQFYPFQSIQNSILEKMDEYYSKTLHDPLLVPGLKEKLLKSMISKVIKSFKCDVNIYSDSIEKKLKGNGDALDRMMVFIEKMQQKQKKEFQLKKQFIIHCSKHEQQMAEAQWELKNQQTDSLEAVLLLIEDNKKTTAKFIKQFSELNSNNP